MYENSIIKPIKIILKRGEGEGAKRVIKGVNIIKFSVCMYGNIRVKLLCT
jgi:hypothetical protein